MADWLKAKYPAIENVGEQKYRAGIIHRLDKDVSGIMVVAKNNEAFNLLKDQFKRRKVKKEYLAIVYGKVSQPEGEIDLPIGRNADGQFVAHPRQGGKIFQADDKIAKTRYRVPNISKAIPCWQWKFLPAAPIRSAPICSPAATRLSATRSTSQKEKFFIFCSEKSE